MSMRRVDEIIVHCTATKEGQDCTVEQVRLWHTMPEPQGRGWSDIGYHFLIYLDGTVMAGRPLERAGAHCTGRNLNSIGVCYVGGLAKDGKTPKDTRTPQQKDALLDLLFVLMQNYGVKLENVRCHNEFAAKACPSFTKEQLDREMLDAFPSIKAK